QMARDYAAKERADLLMGDMSDLHLANAQYMQLRDSLALGQYQTAAKERIRWLSAQLAIARTAIAKAEAAPSTAAQGEREELAKWCDQHAEAMPEDGDECRRIAALLRLPAMVPGDEMVRIAGHAYCDRAGKCDMIAMRLALEAAIGGKNA